MRMAIQKVKRKRDKILLQPTFRLSFEGEKKHIIVDQTDALLLRHISEKNSLTKAAKVAGISYRNAWDRIRELESNLGDRVVEKKVGGREGGGARLTESGLELLKQFRRVRRYLFDALEDREFWEHISYKLSARNRIKGRVVEVQRGTITSEIKIRTLPPSTMTSIISNEAVQELGLKIGDEVEAVVKATDVIVAKKGA